MKDTKTTKQEGGTVRWLKSLFASTETNTPKSQSSQADDGLKDLPQAARRNKTVLVVDDDPVFLLAASMRLDADGYDVLTAKEGSEAIQLARKNKPDALVLDVNLPRDVAGVPWDGFTVMEWLRRFDGLKEVPVIIASNTDAEKISKKVFDAGATGFFQKRMEPSRLVSIVANGIQHPRLAIAKKDSNFQI